MKEKEQSLDELLTDVFSLLNKDSGGGREVSEQPLPAEPIVDEALQERVLKIKQKKETEI